MLRDDFYDAAALRPPDLEMRWRARLSQFNHGTCARWDQGHACRASLYDSASSALAVNTTNQGSIGNERRWAFDGDVAATHAQKIRRQFG
jgi:hypothetical protein